MSLSIINYKFKYYFSPCFFNFIHSDPCTFDLELMFTIVYVTLEEIILIIVCKMII